MRSSMIPAALSLALVALVSTPDPAAAQTTAAETLEAGQQAISVEPFATGGGTTIGWWRVRDEDTRFGWLFNVSASYNRRDIDDDDSSLSFLSLAVGPEVRQYRGADGRVAPFLFLGGDVGVNLSERNPSIGRSETDWTARIGGRAGLGVEFFLLRNLSLDARIGARAGVDYRPLEGGVDAPEDGSVWSIGVSTFTSGLGGSFYF